MENDSITPPADNQADANANPADQNAGTDQQTDANTTGADNLKTSDSTDNSGDEDNSTNDKSEEANSSASKFDTDLDEWAEKTKRPIPTTDRERELYQEIRNGQREFSRSKQAKEATTTVDQAIANAKPADDKAVDEDDERDPVEIRQDALEARLAESEGLRLRSEYFSEKSVSADESKVMGEILQEKVDKAQSPAQKKAAFDYWTNPDNLEDWHSLAKARLVSTKDTSVIEQEAARKERERIAKESQANGSSRSATTTTEKKSGYNRAEYLKSDD